MENIKEKDLVYNPKAANEYAKFRKVKRFAYNQKFAEEYINFFMGKESFVYGTKVADKYTDFRKNSNKTQWLGYKYLLSKLKGNNVDLLDFGTGTGEFLKIIADNKYAKKTIGVDISQKMLDIAKKDANPDELKFMLVDELPSKQKFDIITANYVFCVMETKEKIKEKLSFLVDRLNPGGKLYIQNANRDEANGKDFRSFELQYKKNLQIGDEIFARLKGVDNGDDLVVKDHYHPLSIYKELLTELGMDVSVEKIYEEWVDVAALYVIEATKKQKTMLNDEQKEQLTKAKSFDEMADIAIETLKKLWGSAVQICGPITTGGKGSAEENIQAINDAIDAIALEKNVFDQMIYFDDFSRLIDKSIDYDFNPLEWFYKKIFESGLIKECRFLPGWESSVGACREYQRAKELWIKITYID